MSIWKHHIFILVYQWHVWFQQEKLSATGQYVQIDWFHVAQRLQYCFYWSVIEQFHPMSVGHDLDKSEAGGITSTSLLLKSLAGCRCQEVIALSPQQIGHQTYHSTSLKRIKHNLKQLLWNNGYNNGAEIRSGKKFTSPERRCEAELGWWYLLNSRSKAAKVTVVGKNSKWDDKQ